MDLRSAGTFFFFLWGVGGDWIFPFALLFEGEGTAFTLMLFFFFRTLTLHYFIGYCLKGSGRQKRVRTVLSASEFIMSMYMVPLVPSS